MLDKIVSKVCKTAYRLIYSGLGNTTHEQCFMLKMHFNYKLH